MMKPVEQRYRYLEWELLAVQSLDLCWTILDPLCVIDTTEGWGVPILI